MNQMENWWQDIDPISLGFSWPQYWSISNGYMNMDCANLDVQHGGLAAEYIGFIIIGTQHSTHNISKTIL
jgi:hypothetical protein